MDPAGEWKEDKEGIRQVILNYFSELFHSSENNEVLSEREIVQQISDEQNHSLMEPVTSEEVKLAVFVMHPDKSPGLDGLNPGVFQAYWKIIGEDVVKFCQHFVNTGELPDGVNQTVFLQDEEVFGDIQPSRGIRQGDLISPYLYILCVEGLSSMIKRHEEVGLVHGCSIARGAPAVSHLLFADDCYLFFRATLAEASTMKNILRRYERVSGQTINFGKSSVMSSPNTLPSSRKQVCDVLQVNEISVPGNYLGLPMHIGKRKNNAFKFLSDRVSHKLQSWSNNCSAKALKELYRTLNIPSQLKGWKIDGGDPCA
ncbi:uncharacterized protein LOC141692191 [Apium graveolens]|uniref:uncharacterized protein LOC141692191 n=1 Tax=Apium graveolens TaxID=4045 RepID=UPI003D7AA29E